MWGRKKFVNAYFSEEKFNIFLQGSIKYHSVQKKRKFLKYSKPFLKKPLNPQNTSVFCLALKIKPLLNFPHQQSPGFSFRPFLKSKIAHSGMWPSQEDVQRDTQIRPSTFET